MQELAGSQIRGYEIVGCIGTGGFQAVTVTANSRYTVIAHGLG